MYTLTLVHINGDRKQVTIRTATFVKSWKKGRKILVIHWGDLSGDYALDLESNNLYQFTNQNGIKRKPLNWSAFDVKIAWAIWHKLTEHGRSIDARQRKQ